MVSFVAISDTHCHSLKDILWKIEADVLLHAGDWTYRGTEKELKQMHKFLEEVRPQFKRIVGIWGNHDFCGEDWPDTPRRFKDSLDVDILVDQVIEVEGIKIFGSPWVPKFGDWAFMYARPTKRWTKRPPADIVMTHGPMSEYLDITPRGEHVGCYDLRHSVFKQNPKPKVFVSGHIHHSYGEMESNGVRIFNASTCNEGYDAINPPHQFVLY